LALGGIGFVFFIIAASSNPDLGEYHNDPGLPICSTTTPHGLTCVSFGIHQHALAAQQRFFTALFVGFFTFVFGAALSTLRSGSRRHNRGATK